MVANKRIFLLSFIFFLSGCTSPTVTPPTITSVPEKPTPELSPTSPSPIQVRATKTIEATPAPEPYAGSLAGLIYYDQQGIWKVTQDEEHELIFDFEGKEIRVSRISPSLDKIMYGHIITDINTGETVDLNHYGDYTLCYIEWWPARPNIVLVGLHPISEEIGFACHMIPAIKIWNGPILETLGTEYTFPATKAGSPNSDQVAYDDLFVPWIFTFGKGKERFDYASYGFPELENPRFSDPLWSPSGRFLTWLVFADGDRDDQIMGVVQGIGVFDLVKKTSKFLKPLPVLGADGGRAELVWSPDEGHLLLTNSGWSYFRVINIESEEILYSQDDGSGWPSSWSPDGQWLAYSNYDTDTQIRSIAVDAIDGSDAYSLSSFMLDVWNPESTSLLLQAWDNETSSRGDFFMLDITTGKYYLTDLPSDIRILAWAAD